MKAVVAGPDSSIADALEAEGVEVTRVTDEVLSKSVLDTAGIAEADLYVLTDPNEATSIPLALEANPDLRVVYYAEQSMPEFVRAQVDLALDPDVLDPAVVAEELA